VRAFADLRTADWPLVTAGAARSSFVDGAAGVRTLADGTPLDVTQIPNLANCAKTTTCSAAEMDATSADRPWGALNPRWQLYAYAPLRNVSADLVSPYYVVVLVADDRANSVPGWLLVRAEAFGARGAHRAVEATVARDILAPPALRLVSWREVR
jgi:hypothetical protein